MQSSNSCSALALGAALELSDASAKPADAVDTGQATADCNRRLTERRFLTYVGIEIGTHMRKLQLCQYNCNPWTE